MSNSNEVSEDDARTEAFPRATIGDRLRTIRARSGMSLARIAIDGGWSAASSVQKLFEPHYDPKILSPIIAQKIIAALEHNGIPIDLQEEVNALTRPPARPRRPSPSRRHATHTTEPVSHRTGGDLLDLNRLRPCDRLAMSALYESLLMLAR